MGGTEVTAVLLPGGTPEERRHARESVAAQAPAAPCAGPLEARTPEALGEVATPWTAFLEPPDRWDAGYLASQLAALAATPDTDLVVAGCRYEGPGAGLYATSFDRPDWQPPDALARLCRGAFAHASTVVVCTALLHDVGFDPAPAPGRDLAWLFRVVAAGHGLVVNPEVLVTHGGRAGEDPEEQALVADETRAAYAGDCPACARDALDLVRRRARFLARVGRRREARPWFWRWWKQKPDSTQALFGLLRCLLARK